MGLHGWAAAGFAVAGALAGVVLRARLAGLGYRRPEEYGMPRRRTGWVVPVTAAASALLAGRLAASWPGPVVLTGVGLCWLLVMLAAIDRDVHRLPDALTLPAYPVALVALAGCAWSVGDWAPFLRALLAGPALAVTFATLARLGPGGPGFGLGDVKLAGVLGLVLGWFGWGHVLLGGYASVLTGGLYAGWLILRRRLDYRGQLAFGPFLGLGAVLALTLG